MFSSTNMFRSKVYLSRERNNNSHILHADNGRRVVGGRWIVRARGSSWQILTAFHSGPDEDSFAASGSV